MGKGSSRAPAPPDPQRTAAAQFQFSNFDTYGADGSGVRYGYTDPATGQFVQGAPSGNAQVAVQQVESPWQAQIRQALQPASVSLVNRMIADNVTGLPAAARVKDRSDVARDLFNRSFSMMQPGIERSNERLLTNLQARGIPIGAEAWADAYGTQQRETQDTISRLSMDANLAAGQEQSRQFGLDQAQRQGAIAEIVAAMGGGYNPPSAQLAGGNPSNIESAIANQYNAQMAQWQQRQQNRNSTLGTLGALGGALMKSTMTAKDIAAPADPHALAQIVAGLPLYLWSYKPDEGLGDDLHVGPMAEHWQAVSGLGDGKTINMIDAFGVVLGALQAAIQRIERLEATISTGRLHS